MEVCIRRAKPGDEETLAMIQIKCPKFKNQKHFYFFYYSHCNRTRQG